MGKKFGNLQKLWGVHYYCLSPYELKPFAGMLNPGLYNVFRRIRNNIFVMGVPFLIGFIIYKSANEVYHKSLRKNPDLYKDDV